MIKSKPRKGSAGEDLPVLMMTGRRRVKKGKDKGRRDRIKEVVL